MKVSVVLPEEEYAKAYQALASIKGGFAKAVNNAANRSLTAAQTVLARETAKRYYVTQSEVKKSFTLTKGNGADYHGAIVSRGKRKNISKYKLTPKNNASGLKTGFKGAVKRDGGLKPLSRKSFMMNTPTAGWLLFQRIKPGRYWSSIRHVPSPSIPQIVKNEETVKGAKERAGQIFRERLQHETMRLLGAFK